MKAIVVIVTYAASIKDDEFNSYLQCLKIFSNQLIALICPQTLDTSFYKKLADEYKICFIEMRFPNIYFQNVASYNKLMLEPKFYRRFIDYDYILIYQLDAWVFRDELSFWCNKGYSYIGAPFFNDRGEMFPFAGNGGFSLRRVQDFIELLEGSLQPVKWNYDFMKIQLPAKTPFRARIKQLLHRIEMCVCRLSSKFYCRFMPEHEDFIFAKAFSLAGKNNVPLPKDAAFFSFERHPDQLYLWTGGKLPFGCHAYRKYAGKFWSLHI